MEFTSLSRKNAYTNFYKVSEKTFNKKNSKGNYIYYDFFQCFTYKPIAEGAEGAVLLANLAKIDEPIIIKISNLKKLFETKGLNKDILNRNPYDIYNIFNKLTKDKNLDYLISCLIETLTYTLVNQLVFQNICPNFSINYYWEYKQNTLLYYNECANYSTLFNWLKTKRSHDEHYNMLIQITSAIICMQKYYNMIHGDLHSLNILVHKVKPGGYWKYIINNQEYIVPNLGWIFLVSDYGFTVIPDKIKIDWYYERSIKQLSNKGREFYDFIYLTTHPENINQIVLNIPQDIQAFIHNIIYKYNIHTYKNNPNTINENTNMITILNEFYKLNSIQQIKEAPIEIYNMDKPLNKNLLPSNFQNLSSY
jgi:hypothetical protein